MVLDEEEQDSKTAEKGNTITCPRLPFLDNSAAEAGNPIHRASGWKYRVKVSGINPYPQ